MRNRGEKSFDNCNVKVVEFDYFVFDKGRSGQATLARQLPDAHNKVYAGTFAELHCPKTDDERVHITSKLEAEKDKITAMREVRKLAGELVCRGCRYSGMSPVQVVEEQAQLTRAEADRTEALAALERARSELATATPYEILPRKTEL